MQYTNKDPCPTLRADRTSSWAQENSGGAGDPKAFNDSRITKKALLITKTNGDQKEHFLCIQRGKLL